MKVLRPAFTATRRAARITEPQKAYDHSTVPPVEMTVATARTNDEANVKKALMPSCLSLSI